jgi:SAM-dependent methyltransferase
MTSNCRFCNTRLEHTFIDLGLSPVSNAFLSADDLSEIEPFYPLRAFVCANCFLVQLEEFEAPEQIFSDYVYFSSYSHSWLAHAKSFADSATEQFRLGGESLVIEVASNDGYLLQYFKQSGIPILGIEPAANVADVAIERGIETISEFFGVALAEKLRADDKLGNLVIGNNVLAHVPDVNDFVAGLKIVLAEDGVLCMEFPHLLKLIEQTQFDTIYHEHFSYYSLLTVQRMFAHHGLDVFDVDELPTHGGSLRIYAQHTGGLRPHSDAVDALLATESASGLDSLAGYENFAKQVLKVKTDLLAFLGQAKANGKSVAGYGAPAKGNTLLNYCGIDKDLIEYTVDRNPHKQGLFLPGTHLPVHAPEYIATRKPDYLLILPWNLRDEVAEQMAHIRDWGGKFAVPIPELCIFE